MSRTKKAFCGTPGTSTMPLPDPLPARKRYSICAYVDEDLGPHAPYVYGIYAPNGSLVAESASSYTTFGSARRAAQALVDAHGFINTTITPTNIVKR